MSDHHQVLSFLSYGLNCRVRGENLLQEAGSPGTIAGYKGRTYLWDLHGLCVLCRQFQVSWPCPGGSRVQLIISLAARTQGRSSTSLGPLHVLGKVVLKDTGPLIPYLLCYLSRRKKMSTWSPMTSLGPHEEGEKQITLCRTLCCDIGKYLRLWWHI